MTAPEPKDGPGSESRHGRAHFLQVFLSQRPQMEALVRRRVGCRATAADLVQDYVMWNHPMSEVLNSLLNQNLALKSFDEYNWSPYACFRHNDEFEKGKYRIPQLGSKCPHVFSLVAEKKAD